MYYAFNESYPSYLMTHSPYQLNPLIKLIAIVLLKRITEFIHYI